MSGGQLTTRGQLMQGSSTCMPKVYRKNSLILPQNGGDELRWGDEIHWLSSRVSRIRAIKDTDTGEEKRTGVVPT